MVDDQRRQSSVSAETSIELASRNIRMGFSSRNGRDGRREKRHTESKEFIHGG